MYVVDTNVLSAGAAGKAQAMLDLVSWMERNSDQLYLSVITVAEIEDGIAKVLRQGAVRKAELLAEWLETLLHLYNVRILPLDVAVARLLGQLSDQARAAAAQRGYAVLTRNMRHFRRLAVPCHDPFESLPGGSQERGG